ncbi:Domain of uncharacterised function (DUF2825) [Mycobacteroides abscessus subsp. abscessus]|nr:Domain of uncharacterised function (DUF2825) [Mycobacteroides abscessus subsp. abscessus]SIG44726.1 Domain of uncharacterised function (DUF2825) [Mycobacteroides abscessus subsp. abscessus]SIM97380.1 Domain of uncharacterised function (DUF2825) [Mycobacteroides abscessus subsp. abscessus]SIN10154.1 Domain of uncharacterised function (DUF2825) [Mycobacteroides abscessus subsp. abscessus]SIN15597.1 Domain of uncharacterised function (DUF2825) [Mycobacteroides abscessus subsp. abscessus]
MSVSHLVATVGSSPLARGAEGGTESRKLFQRFIPARAGRRRCRRRPRQPSPVHPRLRWEQVPRVPNFSCAFGSSPLALGAGTEGAQLLLRLRFIPARAGSRRTEIGDSGAVVGSSPLARGAVFAAGRQRRRLRFIPACAGSSRSSLMGLVRRAVHPRLRGEQSGDVSLQKIFFGSSPLARGADFLTWDDTARVPSLTPVTS